MTLKALSEAHPDVAEPALTGPSVIDDDQDERSGDSDVDRAADAASEEVSATTKAPWKRADRRRALAFGVLPAIAMLIALGAGYMKWQSVSSRNTAAARTESVQAARDSTTAMLSYKPDTVEQQLNDAQDRLTGSVRDAYATLTHDVVIPGAKQQGISATVDIPAAASVSASPAHAVVLVFVNQTAIVGNSAPSTTASSVRVSLDRVDGRWLVSGFDPI